MHLDQYITKDEQNLVLHFVPYTELSKEEQSTYNAAIQKENSSFINL